ncbi:hypothetical protein [Caballeronia hypogeia]|nr:hypothetical protein [Caballeronia hypogeia]
MAQLGCAAEPEDEIEPRAFCEWVDLRTLGESAHVSGSARFLYFRDNPGFDSRQVRSIAVGGYSVYEVPISTLSVCAEPPDLKKAVRKMMLAPDGAELALLEAFDRYASNEKVKTPKVLELAIDHSSDFHRFDKRSFATIDQLAVESAYRYRWLQTHGGGRFTMEELSAAAALEERRFPVMVVYTGVIDHGSARDLLVQMAFAAREAPSDIVLVGHSDTCEPGRVMYLEELPPFGDGPVRYEFIDAPGIRSDVCGGTAATLSTEIPQVPSHTKSFDSLDPEGKSFYIVDLVKRALLEAGITDAKVYAAGPVDTDLAYIGISNLLNSVNPEGAFSGPRLERLLLHISRNGKKLTIEQRYEYSNFKGTQRWRDPEQRQFADDAFARGAQDFLGVLISSVKLLILKGE